LDIDDLKTVTGFTAGTGGAFDQIIGETIYLDGTLTINSDIKFVNCNFYMAEGAKIDIINSADVSYEITDNTDDYFIKTCDPDNFWDGIYIDGGTGSDLTFKGLLKSGKNNLTISNSFNGIRDTNQAAVRLTRVSFNRNNRCLHFDGPNPLGSNILDVRSCTFECTSPLKDTQGSSYYPEYSVIIRNFRGSTFGAKDVWFHKTSASNDEAYFEGSAGGILSVNSDLQIDSIEFRNFEPTLFGPQKQLQAIEFYSSDGVTNSTGALSRLFLEFKYNDFTDVRSGILVSSERLDDTTITNVLFTITNNTFNDNGSDYKNVGIELRRVIDSVTYSSTISDNEFYNQLVGLSIVDCQAIDIYDNFFDMEVQSGSSYASRLNNYSHAILIDNTDFSNVVPAPNYAIKKYHFLIYDNTIQHSKIGIKNNFGYASITDNDIFDTNDNKTYGGSGSCGFGNPCPPRGYAIRILNEAVLLEQNDIDNNPSYYSPDPSTDNSTDNLVGISLENTSSMGESELYCNKVENFGFGFSFSGNCGDVEVLNNSIKQHYRGFVLVNEADIGDVGQNATNGGAENVWFGTFGSSGSGSHTYNFSYATGANPTHYVSTNAPSINPILDKNAGLSAMSTTSVAGDNTYSCTTPMLLNLTGNQKGIANLKSGQSTRVNPFARSGKLSDSAEALNYQLLYWKLRGSNIDSNIEAKAVFDSLKLTSLVRGLENKDQLNGGTKAYELAINEVTNARVELKKNDSLSIATMNKLRTLANSCPYDYGIAVYFSRRLLFDEINVSSFISDCEINPDNSQNRQLRISDELGIEDFQLYPNPAYNKIAIEFAKEEGISYELLLFDVNGKMVIKKAILNSNQTIDINGLSSGLFLYQITKNDIISKMGKLVINDW